MAARRLRIAIFVGLTAVGLACGGCISSHSARYERQLTTAIQPDRTTNAAVAVAFGLDGHKETTTAVAVVEDH